MRARLLGLFILLAVVPILILGIVEYTRSLRALETLIATENGRVASRIAQVLDQRAALLESDLLLLTENAETQRWLSARGTAGPAAVDADRFLRDAWSRMSVSNASLAYRDGEGRVLYSLGQVSSGPGSLSAVERPVRDLNSGAVLGTLVLQPALPALLPLDLLATGFGSTGQGMVIDRAAGRVLYHPDPSRQGADLEPLIREEHWEAGPVELGGASGSFRYRTGDTVRVASWASVRGLPWSVVVSGRLDEFSGPFTEVRRTTLLLFLAVAALAALAFHLLLRRTTRSLLELTEATAVVGQGNFSPDLPPAGRDEVGRLTIAFGTMADRVREMVGEIRASRQMAVLGEFAANVSHEIRNPLTSIKLNLQKLEREQRAGRLPSNVDQPLEIALREVGRLDGVVRGVLELGRQRPPAMEACRLSRLAADALEIVAPQAEAREVSIERPTAMDADTVRADPGQLKGAILNLVLNAVEAMPNGGVLRVTTWGDDASVFLRISDSGPGIPPDRRAEVFRPFVTGKDQGVGLGLPLARRAIEDNGGVLMLGAGDSGLPGAEFTITIPRHTG